jgi:hypothetical protein
MAIPQFIFTSDYPGTGRPWDGPENSRNGLLIANTQHQHGCDLKNQLT